MCIQKKFSHLEESFRYIDTLEFKSHEVVQFLPEDILNKDTQINKVKLSFESINGLISV
jgi:hypothetical protein